MKLEKQNIPVATVCTDEFFALGKAEAEFLGMPGLPIAAIPHPMAGQSSEQVTAIASQALGEIVHILTTKSELLESEYKDKTEKTEKKSRLRHKSLFGDEFSNDEATDKLKAPDSLEAVNRIFYFRGWTDGLPIIPPTEARVFRMIGPFDREPKTIVGTIAPKHGEATLEKIAINAVMAGCLPEHFPLIIAATRAMIQETFNLFALQTTTHPCAVLLLFNGPLVDELDINYSYNAMAQGTLSNATIGRTIRLLLINVGGASPGIMDRATHGSPAKFSFCFAENEAQNPWDPLHVERGFAKSLSTVTVMGAESPHNVNDHGSSSGEEILFTISGVLATPGNNNVYLGGEPMVVLGPEHAAIIARDGFSKQAVKQYLFEKARVALTDISRGNLERFRRNHPQRFSALGDRDKVPLVDKSEEIIVVVAGGMGRHSMVIPTFGGHTRAVTMPITDSNGNPIVCDER